MTVQLIPLGDILSITTGWLVSRDHMGGVYRVLNHMTGEDLFTHALSRASEECRPRLLEQHPQLAAVQFPERDDWSTEGVYAWLTEQEAIFGTELPVSPLGPDDHTSIDPITELRMKRPDIEIMTIEIDRDGDQ